jgi:hypoxanthine phosphoribosyltransferase
MDDEREDLTWQAFGQASRELAQAIADDGFEPDLILSIARGGLFLAGSLGYALAVKNLHVMNVEFYDGVGTTLDMPVMLPPVPSAVDFSEKKVLIADDVADSGRTIELVYTFIRDHVADVRSAVIYEKPRSLIRCDYVWKHTDRWINFPWSSAAPVVQRAGQVFDASAVVPFWAPARHDTANTSRPRPSLKPRQDASAPAPTTQNTSSGTRCGACWLGQ